MNKLYADLAEVYEAMYATFINYEEEYLFYSNLLKKFHKKSVLEIGSGTGNLAPFFINNSFEYIGLDLSEDMLAIAKQKNPDCTFLKGDMRTFELSNPIESAIITGRSISYLLDNKDVNAAFKSIHHNLTKGGILCFDFIDANRFIPAILKEKKVTHEAMYKDINYIREGIWTPNLAYGMDLKWVSTYYKQIDTNYQEIGSDTAIARSFTKNEIELFLAINGFEVQKMIDRPTYAFPTFVAVAKKI